MPQTGRSMTTSPYCLLPRNCDLFRHSSSLIPEHDFSWRFDQSTARLGGRCGISVRFGRASDCNFTPTAKRGRQQKLLCPYNDPIHPCRRNIPKARPKNWEIPDCASCLQEPAPRPGTNQNYLHSSLQIIWRSSSGLLPRHQGWEWAFMGATKSNDKASHNLYNAVGRACRIIREGWKYRFNWVAVHHSGELEDKPFFFPFFHKGATPLMHISDLTRTVSGIWYVVISHQYVKILASTQVSPFTYRGFLTWH